jgi:hypothetical protein
MSMTSVKISHLISLFSFTKTPHYLAKRSYTFLFSSWSLLKLKDIVTGIRFKKKMAVSPEAYAIISQKKAKYCRLADTQQWDKFDSIMLPNATYSFHDPDGSVIIRDGTTFSWSSRDEWAAFFNNENKEIQAIHNIGPPEMEQVAPDEIKAIWSVIYHAGNKNAESGVHGTGGGYYHETWKKVGDDWFMATLRMERLYWKMLMH